jgi:hypothetical protein
MRTPNPTTKTYKSLDDAFVFFNRRLFGGRLAADGVDLEELDAMRSVTDLVDTARFDSENPLVVRLIQRVTATGQVPSAMW